MHVQTRENVGRGARAALVIALHLLVIYAIAVSLNVVRAPAFVKPIQAVMIDSQQPAHEEKPVLSKPQLSQPDLNVPLPETPPVVDEPVETAIAPSPDPTPTNSNSISDANLQVTRRVDPAYPPASRRAAEQGTAVLSVLVDASGHPQDVKVQTSSGFDRLDQAAMQAIHRWVFNPAVRDSQKVTAWTTVRVAFRLEDVKG